MFVFTPKFARNQRLFTFLATLTLMFRASLLKNLRNAIDCFSQQNGSSRFIFSSYGFLKKELLRCSKFAFMAGVDRER
jgi:hypothetical protein